MSSTLARVRGRLRLARGRCPACASEAPEGCGVCLGHQGPYPPDSEQMARWAFRFEASLGRGGAQLRSKAARGVPAWTPAWRVE